MNPRRRRSISPKLWVNEKKFFDDISLSNSQKSLDDDSNIDNFSFIDEDVHSNGELLSEYDSSSSMRNDRIKRSAVSDHTEPVANNRELYFESLQFDAESDEEIRGPNKGRRKNKNNNNNGSNNNNNNSGRIGNGSSNAGKTRKDDENDDNKEPPLDKLVKDIRTKVKDSKKFWSNLPYQICNNDEVAASPSNDANCWNGNKIDR